MYYYDSYSIIEYVRGNERYRKYFRENGGVTTIFSLMEIYYILLKDADAQTAGTVYDGLIRITVSPDHDFFKRAMETRLRLKKEGKNASYADAVGYQYALENGMKFLTGDREFEKLPNVEFVR